MPGMNLAWALMITSSANKGWEGDVSLETRHEECGLRVPCVIRTAKFATLSIDRAEKVGALPADLLAEVRAELALRLSADDQGKKP